ncbi:MAG: sodium-dependent bicarbonate transport family permease, partial [Cyclobacteriaceae bacterium]|nr:sodium-dependent bicarbonate transport family permease [Cyclobacteriaceae bacterium HetDA_MAG_MS6]
MHYSLLIDNLTNPALLFFCLGILAVRLKSDLEIPATSAKFISLYLLFSIGFKGGQELSHSPIDGTTLASLLFGVLLALIIPLYSFLMLRKKVGVANAAAIAAAYGSVSAVTFVTAVSFLDMQQVTFNG